MNTRDSRPELPCRPRHAGASLLAAGIALFAAIPIGAGTLPEDALLAGNSGDFRQPQLRCEWIAGRFDSIAEQLSLYREELGAFVVTVDGVAIGDSTTGAVLSVEFESRRSGPGSATLALDRLRAPALASLALGRQIEIQFADRSRTLHPLFCGQVALIRADPASTRIDVVALMPRTGTEGQASTRFLEMSCVDVLKQLAASAGLAFEVQDRRQRVRFPSIPRSSQATWPFMRSLGRLCQYDLALRPGGLLFVTESAFAPPPPPAPRAWNNVTLKDIANDIASRAGRGLDARLTRAYPKLTLVQRLADEEFLAGLAAASQVSAWFAPGTLMLTEDGVWTPAPPAPAVTAADALLWRVTATGSAVLRSFTRQHADPALYATDPERVPRTQATLLLGRSMAAVTPPRFALADRATVDAMLEAAFQRLAQPAGQTPERRFLLEYARAHRPTLLHLYRLRPDGTRTLDAIGR